MPVTATGLAPIPVGLPDFNAATTVLAIGVVPGLDASVYGIPYVIENTISAANAFGLGRFTRAIGELFRQQTPTIIAIALADEDDIPSIFNYMIDQVFSIIVPVGLTITTNRAKLFGQFAYQREQRGRPVVIVMSADPSPGVDALVASPVAATAGSIIASPNNILLSRYFVVTLDQVIVNPDIPSEYQADAAPAIAGLIAKTPVKTPITYQSLLGLELANPYSNTDLVRLSTAGYTVCTNSIRHGAVPFLGVTATSADPNNANYSAGYHKLSTFRVASYVANSLQDATFSLIGENSAGLINDVIKKDLDALKSGGIILDYDYDVQVYQTASLINIDVSILPPYETTMISVTSQVRLTRS
jgi:hypothetical protein